MKEFSFKGFKMKYPAGLKVHGDFNYVKVTRPKSRSPYLSLGLWPAEYSFEDTASHLFQTARVDFNKIVREGDYPKIPGAKEVFYKSPLTCDLISYTWDLIIPLGRRFMTVQWVGQFDDTDRSVPVDFSDLNEVWIPIIESMEFDVDLINTLPDYPGKEKNWTKITGAPKSFKQVISPGDGFIGLYDSAVEFFDKDDEGWVAEIDDEAVAAGFIKMNQRLILFTRRDGPEVPVDFHFGAEAQPLDKWAGVIEGVLGTSSGEMCFGDDFPTVKIKMQKGSYKFRWSFGFYNKERDDGREEYWRIDLWPGSEEETNEVKILK